MLNGGSKLESKAYGPCITSIRRVIFGVSANSEILLFILATVANFVKSYNFTLSTHQLSQKGSYYNDQKREN